MYSSCHTTRGGTKNARQGIETMLIVFLMVGADDSGGTKKARQGMETRARTRRRAPPGRVVEERRMPVRALRLGGDVRPRGIRRLHVEERRMPVRALRHVLGVFSDGAPSHVGGGTKNARQGIETRCRQLPLRRSHGLWRDEECPSGH